jgi:hypothetical protein
MTKNLMSSAGDAPVTHIALRATRVTRLLHISVDARSHLERAQRAAFLVLDASGNAHDNTGISLTANLGTKAGLLVPTTLGLIYNGRNVTRAFCAIHKNHVGYRFILYLNILNWGSIEK